MLLMVTVMMMMMMTMMTRLHKRIGLNFHVLFFYVIICKTTLFILFFFCNKKCNLSLKQKQANIFTKILPEKCFLFMVVSMSCLVKIPDLGHRTRTEPTFLKSLTSFIKMKIVHGPPIQKNIFNCAIIFCMWIFIWKK